MARGTRNTKDTTHRQCKQQRHHTQRDIADTSEIRDTADQCLNKGLSLHKLMHSDKANNYVSSDMDFGTLITKQPI